MPLLTHVSQFPIPEDRNDDQQVSQHVHHSGEDEHAGQQPCGPDGARAGLLSARAVSHFPQVPGKRDDFWHAGKNCTEYYSKLSSLKQPGTLRAPHAVCEVIRTLLLTVIPTLVSCTTLHTHCTHRHPFTFSTLIVCIILNSTHPTAFLSHYSCVKLISLMSQMVCVTDHGAARAWTSLGAWTHAELFPRFAPLTNTDGYNADFTCAAGPKAGLSMLNYNYSPGKPERRLCLLRETEEANNKLARAGVFMSSARWWDGAVTHSQLSRQLHEHKLAVVFKRKD